MLCKKAKTLGRLTAIGGRVGVEYLHKLSQHFKTCKICKPAKKKES